MTQETFTHSPDNGQVDSPSVTATPPRLRSCEVVPRPQRRTFTGAYKRRILAEAEACQRRGELGALLRREGLYSSHLVDWRRQRRRGRLGQGQRGQPPADAAAREIACLQRQVARLQQRLAQAEAIIEVQKNLRAPWAPPVAPETPGRLWLS